jgi:hypothetical protein
MIFDALDTHLRNNTEDIIVAMQGMLDRNTKARNCTFAYALLVLQL